MPMAELERDVRDHAKTLTEYGAAIRALNDRVGKIENDRTTEGAVGIERRGNMDDRLDRIEERIGQVYSLGKWALGAVGTLFVAAFVAFVLKGGLIG